MIQNFVNEIECLLSEIPADQWADPTRCGLCYDFVPWHNFSGITLQTRADRSDDVTTWKYYTSAESDAARLNSEIELCRADWDRLFYHRLLIEAAEAILSIDLTRYVPNLFAVKEQVLYKPFQLQVYDLDGTFGFNYCEYVLARRLEAA